jgi:hypothetical protein
MASGDTISVATSELVPTRDKVGHHLNFFTIKHSIQRQAVDRANVGALGKRRASAASRRLSARSAAIHTAAAGRYPAAAQISPSAPLQGFDVEPSTLTDFNGSSAVAFHVGSARASDGLTYNLETDIRAFEGEYIVGGVARHASFAMI